MRRALLINRLVGAFALRYVVVPIRLFLDDDVRRALVFASTMTFSPLRGPRRGIRTQIGLALGMPRESVPSAQELWDFLVTSTQKKMSAHERMFREAKNSPTKVSKANSHSPCPRHDIALAALSSLRTWQDRRCFLK